MTDRTFDAAEVARLLGFDTGEDASMNLAGALHDLTHRHKPNDGGVCARTIARVIDQIEQVRQHLIEQEGGRA